MIQLYDLSIQTLIFDTVFIFLFFIFQAFSYLGLLNARLRANWDYKMYDIFQETSYCQNGTIKCTHIEMIFLVTRPLDND